MSYVWANNVLTTLNAALTAVATSMVVDGAPAPNNTPPDPAGGVALLTLMDKRVDPSKIEVVAYTGYTDHGDGTYTLSGLTRGMEGTSGQAWSAGDVAHQSVTAGMLTDVISSADNTLVVDDVNGRIGIGLTSPTQRFTIKSAGTNTYPITVIASDGSNLFRVYETSGGDGQVYLKDAAGTDQIVLKSNADSYVKGGDLGIGTSSPNAPLHVVDDSGAAGYVFRAEGVSGPLFEVYDYNNSNGAGIFIRDQDGTINWVMKGSGVSYMATGSLGLGTTSPTSPLSFPATSGDKINLFDDGTSVIGFGVGAGELQIGGYSSASSQHTSFGHFSGSGAFAEQMRLMHASGYLGIGTIAPSRTLHVAGDVRITGLPTSASGLSSGDLWRNGTVVNIVA